ncbi:MAG: hypothetical protein ABI340_05685 [Nitrososphaera sp.]|jgi:hypothetical protein
MTITLDDQSTTESISISVDKKTLDRLRKIAESHGTTLDIEISKQLRFDLAWTIPAIKTGWVPIPKDILESIMDKLDDEVIEEIASEQGKNAYRDLVSSMKGQYNIKNALEVMALRAKAAGFHYNEIYEDDEINFVFQHSMGIKWSLYFKILIESVLYDLGCKARFSLTENTIVYTIKKSYLK